MSNTSCHSAKCCHASEVHWKKVSLRYDTVYFMQEQGDKEYGASNDPEEGICAASVNLQRRYLPPPSFLRFKLNDTTPVRVHRARSWVIVTFVAFSHLFYERRVIGRQAACTHSLD